MDWDDIDDILFNGTEEEIKAVRCPECGGELSFFYYPEARNYEIRCGCTLIRGHGAAYVPNFARFNINASKKSV